jgi:hypothetical protein
MQQRQTEFNGITNFLQQVYILEELSPTICQVLRTGAYKVQSKQRLHGKTKVSHHDLAHYTNPWSGVCFGGWASLVISSSGSAFPLMISMQDRCLLCFG